MPQTVFIDGAAGTTGLEIVERLAPRSEFQLIILDDEQRKSASARRDAFHAADFAVLCLPDDAALAAVSSRTMRCRCRMTSWRAAQSSMR